MPRWFCAVVAACLVAATVAFILDRVAAARERASAVWIPLGASQILNQRTGMVCGNAGTGMACTIVPAAAAAALEDEVRRSRPPTR